MVLVGRGGAGRAEEVAGRRGTLTVLSVDS